MKRIFEITIASIAIALFVIPHTRVLNRPFVGLHDIINGFHVTVVQLWRTEGIQKHGFAPVFTFQPANLNIPTLGAKSDNGRSYYASYPPGSFWWIYATSFLPGIGVSETTARFTSLIAFLIALPFLFSYLWTTLNLPAAILGAGLFSLIPSSAYFFGGVTGPDTTPFAFWVPAFVMISFYFRSKKKLFMYFFFILLTLTALTEWIGFFTGASVFVYFIIRFIKTKKQALKETGIMLIGTIASMSTALITTIAVFTSVISLDSLISLWRAKQTYRGGITQTLAYLAKEHAHSVSLVDGFIVWLNRVVIGYLWTELTPWFWLIAIIMFIGAFIAIRLVNTYCSKTQFFMLTKRSVQDNGLVLSIFVVPAILHTVLLFQGHFEHDIFLLSYLPGLVIFVAKAYYTIMESINTRFQYPLKGIRLLSLITAIIVLLLFYKAAQPTYRFLFYDMINKTAYKTISLYSAARLKTQPNDLILTNKSFISDVWFYLQRNAISWIPNEREQNPYKGYFQLFSHVYYLSDYKQYILMACKKARVERVNNGWMCQLK